MTATLHEVRFLAGRSLRHIPRIPEKALGAVLLPLVFVVLFAYVFGSAIQVPGGGDYHAHLVSGIVAQTMIRTLPGVAVGVASDIRTGRMDRLRTLPVAGGSVIAGRTVAGLVELCAGVIVVAPCGLVAGWAPDGSVLETIGAFALRDLRPRRGAAGRPAPDRRVEPADRTGDRAASALSLPHRPARGRLHAPASR
jgi:ABC-2 type transport system permease protein